MLQKIREYYAISFENLKKTLCYFDEKRKKDIYCRLFLYTISDRYNESTQRTYLLGRFFFSLNRILIKKTQNSS